ncbi:MAG: cupin domain-containing protein [Gammaproteobacteria bacterium]
MKVFQVAVLPLTFALSFLVPPATWADSQSSHVMLVPTDLKWADVPSLPPGAKVTVIEGPLNDAVPFTFRLKFPANYKVPAHWHPAIEHVTVISGTFNMGTGDKLDPSKTMPLSAGSVAIMQPKTNHFAWTKEETIIQVHGVGPWAINYVNPTDDPRKK